MRTLLVLLVFLLFTPPLGLSLIVAALLRLPVRRGGIYDFVPRAWSQLVLAAAGVKVIVHHPERMQTGEPHVFVANHMSWFDVFTLAATLPHPKFIAKAELGRIPLFGSASRAAGMIFIDRDNRKAAFAGYEAAAKRIEAGASVVVFPEGTRGSDYGLRPFKKGPFVLAVASGAPIVPTLVHGTAHIQPKGGFRVRSGEVHVHLLEPVPTAGLSYEDRDKLSQETWQRMANALRAEYGVESREGKDPRRLATTSA